MLQISQRPLSGSELDQELFVGRVAELTKLRRAMDLRFNVLLLGERGMGATSLIHHCSALIHDDLIHDEEPPILRCLIVDGGAAKDIRELVTAIRQVLGRCHGSLESSIARGLHSQRLQQDTYSNPITELRDLAYAVQGHNFGVDSTIIIDNMNDTKLAHNLFGRQRDDLWEVPFRWVVCGRLSRRTEYLTPPADAFFDTELILEPLDDSVAKSLLEARIDSSNSSDAEKAEKIRSHLHEIVRHGNGNPRQLLNKARSITLQDLSNKRADEHMFTYDAKLTNTEESVLRYLQSRGPTSASEVEFQDYIDVTRERLTQVLRQLENNGLVFSFFDKSGAGRPRKYYSSNRAA